MESEKIIITRIIGGLGNQMYQYALAKHLSILNNDAPVILDISLFEKYFRQYELQKLNIKASVADKETIYKMNTGRLPDLLGRVIDLIPCNCIKDYIRKPFSMAYDEKGIYFHPEVLDIRSSVYLKGNWCSYKYFTDIREQLLEDFSFKANMNDANRKLADLIQNAKNSVSLHIRRGDYLKSINQKIYCSPFNDGFYERAINELEKISNDLVFFLFSDDPEWVKENLKLKHKFTVVDINKDENSYWDMKLMSLCKYNIIANSTFSWWGAWLNKNISKVVIAPKAWVNDKDFSLEDTIPPDWIIL